MGYGVPWLLPPSSATKLGCPQPSDLLHVLGLLWAPTSHTSASSASPLRVFYQFIC